MFKSGAARTGGMTVMLLGAAILAGCKERQTATPEEIARFKYCSGFTAATEQAAYRGLVDLATTGGLRAQQIAAANRLLLPPEEMITGLPKKTDVPTDAPAAPLPTPTEVGRGLLEGRAIIDKGQQKELTDTIQTCGALFATLAQ